MIRRAARFVLEAVAFVIAGLAILIAVVAWRLQAGPIEVDALTPVLESQMAEGPVRLDIDRTLLRWQGFDRPVALVVEGVRLSGPDDGLITAIPEMEVGFTVPALLRRDLVPRRLTVIRPTVRVIREADGSVNFELGEAAADEPDGSEPDVVGVLLRALEAPAESEEAPMAALREVTLRDGRVIVDDRALGQQWYAPDADITLTRVPEGVAGRLDLTVDLRGTRVRLGVDALYRAGGAEGTPSIDLDAAIGLQLDGRPARLAAAATLRPGAPRTTVAVEFENVVPAALADLDPVLAPLHAIGSPMHGNALVAVDDSFRPDFVDFQFRGAQGRIDVPGLYDQPLTIAGLEARGGADLEHRRFVIERLTVDLGGPMATARMVAQERGDRLAITADGEVSGLPVDLLDTYWPPDLGGGARSWVTRNVNRGLVERAEVFLELDAPADDLEAVVVESLDGGIDFTGVTLTVLDGLPPITDIDGHARFDAAVFSIDTSGGRFDALTVPESRIAITGLDTAAADDAIDIETVVTGPVPAALSVLDRPPLGFMEGFGIDPAATSGSMSARLRFAFPLIADLQFEEVAVAAAANLRDTTLGAVGPGLIVTGADAALSLDGREMSVEGTAALNGVPLTFTWSEPFSGTGGTQIDYAATVDAAERDALGLPELPWLEGAVPVRGRLTPAGGAERLTVSADLTGAALDFDPLPWSKPPGQPASLDLTAVLGGGGVARLDDVVLEGPGLTLRGSAAFAGGDRLSAVTVDRVSLGRSELSGRAERGSDGGWEVVVSGPVLDLRPLLDDALSVQARGATEEDEDLPPLALTIQVGEVITGDDRRLVGLRGDLLHDGTRWRRIELGGQAGSGGGLGLRLLSAADGAAELSVDAADAGAALAALDLVDSIRGGTLTIRGSRPADGMFSGSAEMRDFRAVDAPVLARLLAAVSLGGLQSLLTSDGLDFARAELDWRLDQDAIQISQGRAAGGALGITADGTVDRGTGTIDLEGTVVPVYGVNRVIGAIPLLGDILTGGGEGVFAFTYAVSGPVADPAVSVNPVSVLAPGFLRTLFFQADRVEGEESVPPVRREDDPSRD